MRDTVVLSREQLRSFSYPAGEWQVRIAENALDYLHGKRVVVVSDDATVPESLVQLNLLSSALSDPGLSVKEQTLVLPYLPYGRADRRFVQGDCDGLASFRSMLGSWDRVVTLDAHNVARSAELGITSVAPIGLIMSAVFRFASSVKSSRIRVVYPDAGASARYHLPTVIGNNMKTVDVVFSSCKKTRDKATGRLSDPIVPDDIGAWNEPLLVVDDICDGGRTFINLAKCLPNLPRALYVTHGIFSQGVEGLLHLYDRLYTSDSLPRAGEASSVIRLPFVSQLVAQIIS